MDDRRLRPQLHGGICQERRFPVVVDSSRAGGRGIRRRSPEFAYKIYVLVSAAAVPWLIALACALWRIPAAGVAIAVLLDLLYIWTDFPINYVDVRDAALFSGRPGGTGGHRRVRAIPDARRGESTG